MLNKIRQMIGTAATTMDIAYKLSQGLDYKTLNKYILKINTLNDIEGILYEASHCLKDILSYDLFAFGVKNDDLLDIWIDPNIDDKRLAERVRNDFGSQKSDISVHYFKDALPAYSQFNDDGDFCNILSFPIERQKFSARLYLLPGRRMLRYHDEIIDAVLNAVGIAFDHSLNIKQLQNAAFIDSLTGCYNRRALNSYLDHDIADAQRYGRELSVIMFDIDFFKKINDAFGHQAGDMVLTEISGIISSAVRKSDYLGRYGGEEFMLVLSNTGLSNAAELAELLRKKVESHTMKVNGKKIWVTASFGVATIKGGYSRTQLVQDADRMLYRAKARGRNNVMYERFSFTKKHSSVSKQPADIIV